jgi:ribonuclease BN (tRNA processing enzyme)
VDLQLIMIGTGSAFAKQYFNNNSLWITDRYTLLIDCGITAPMALHQLGISIGDLDGVLITHLHGDHVGGLEEIAFQFQFRFGRKLQLFIPEKLAEPLWNHCLRAGMEDAQHSSLEDYFDVHLLKETEPHRIADGLTVEIVRTEHIAEKLSYSLIINRDIFYSADMKFAPDLLTRLDEERQLRLILHDCQLHGPGIVHASLEELRSLPEHIRRKAWLMHYDDDMETFIGQTGGMRFIRQHQRYAIDERGIREI